MNITWKHNNYSYVLQLVAEVHIKWLSRHYNSKEGDWDLSCTHVYNSFLIFYFGIQIPDANAIRCLNASNSTAWHQHTPLEYKLQFYVDMQCIKSNGKIGWKTSKVAMIEVFRNIYVYMQIYATCYSSTSVPYIITHNLAHNAFKTSILWKYIIGMCHLMSNYLNAQFSSSW